MSNKTPMKQHHNNNLISVGLQAEHIGPLVYSAGEHRVRPGSLALVPLRGKEVLGFVLGPYAGPLPAKVKEIISCSTFAATESYLGFLQGASRYYCAKLGAVIKAALPVNKFPVQAAGQGGAQPPEGRKKRGSAPSFSPSPTQEAVVRTIEGYGAAATLLHGVAGSGKTIVYLELARKALQDNKQILILSPEINLANQMAKTFEAALGGPVTLWHSGVPGKRKREVFASIIAGTPQVILGVRSALFLPYPNLQRIIVDEEHDQSYKQSTRLCYNARDMAVLRGSLNKVAVLLASATPSVESYVNAQEGRYKYLQLTERFFHVAPPKVELLSMHFKDRKADQWICQPLREHIREALDSKQQALLFLNRKGYAPVMLCTNCGNRQRCPSCSAPVVFYKAENLLRCHYCGKHKAVPAKCEQCSTPESLRPCGPGIEKVAEEVRACFPAAKIAIISGDDPKLSEATLKAFRQKELDLLIGTQVITKGHHFPNLTMVGVIDADLGLYGGDIRALEKTFQLLHQVSGRAGREKGQGTAYIQTYFAQSEIMQMLQDNNFDQFIEKEVERRRNTSMPPFRRCAKLEVMSAGEQEARKQAMRIAQLAPKDDSVELFGPIEARVFQVKDAYRFKLLLLAKRAFDMQGYVNKLLEGISSSKVRVKVDIDPYDFD